MSGDPLKDLDGLTKSGRVDETVTHHIGHDYVMADFFVRLIDIKDHLSKQDIERAHLEGKVDRTLAQTTITNGRVTELEDWRGVVDGERGQIHDANMVRRGKKMAFSMGWKSVMAIFTLLVGAAAVGSGIKDWFALIIAFAGHFKW